MRGILASILFWTAIALASPDIFAAFEPALLGDTPSAQDNDTIAEQLDLVKRFTGCATGYASCANLNAPDLCCRTNQVCSADAANHIACCPANAACTGTIAPVAGATASATTTTTSPYVFGTSTITAAPTTTGSFVQNPSGASNSRSTVPNSFYPFAFIPTTYANAAACSSAYTSCNSDAASCYTALASGVQGVTVSAPNGGAVITAVPSLGTSAASSVCSSLSSLGCYNLNVAACANFGGATGGAGARCTGAWYGAGAGVAVGLAGQLLR